MGKKSVTSLASLAACMSLAVIVFYLCLFSGLLFPGSLPFSSSSLADLYSRVLPPVTHGPCNCTFHVTSTNPSPGGVVDQPASSSVDCTCGDFQHAKDKLRDLALATYSSLCANASQSGASLLNDTTTQGSGNKETVVKFEPWYAQGRTWHYPVMFPRCSMDICFNYSRCEGANELLIYSYDSPSPPVKYFSGIKDTRWHTDDASKACLFFVYLDLNSPHRPHPKTLPYWNDGMNHVLITFTDIWSQRGPPQQTIGYASVMASDMHETIYRPGFDISIPLPGKMHMRELQLLKPYKRRFLLTFRGLRYLGKANSEGVLRSSETFRSMHNGEDVIVVTSCRHATNNIVRKEAPELGVNCEEDQAEYVKYSYKELMNTTFGLVPAGRQPNSYRMIEVLSAGVVPVLVADNYVKPLDTLIQWHRCLLQFPSSEMQRILPTIRAMSIDEVERRQDYCTQIYYEFLKDDSTLVGAAVASLRARFLGSLPLKP